MVWVRCAQGKPRVPSIPSQSPADTAGRTGLERLESQVFDQPSSTDIVLGMPARDFVDAQSPALRQRTIDHTPQRLYPGSAVLCTRQQHQSQFAAPGYRRIAHDRRDPEWLRSTLMRQMPVARPRHRIGVVPQRLGEHG